MFVVCTCFRVLFRVFLQAGKTTYLTESLVFFEENRKPDFWASKSSQDFAADLASLRDDIAKLNSSLSEFIRTHSATTMSAAGLHKWSGIDQSQNGRDARWPRSGRHHSMARSDEYNHFCNQMPNGSPSGDS